MHLWQYWILWLFLISSSLDSCRYGICEDDLDLAEIGFYETVLEEMVQHEVG